jgi:hypothetical protein
MSAHNRTAIGSLEPIAVRSSRGATLPRVDHAEVIQFEVLKPLLIIATTFLAVVTGDDRVAGPGGSGSEEGESPAWELLSQSRLRADPCFWAFTVFKAIHMAKL